MDALTSLTASLTRTASGVVKVRFAEMGNEINDAFDVGVIFVVFGLELVDLVIHGL